MILFSIDGDNYHLVCYQSKICVDNATSELQAGSFIVLISDNCFEFPTFQSLYDFIKNELDCLIDP